MYPCTVLDETDNSSDSYKFQMGPVKRSTDKRRVLKSFEKRVAWRPVWDGPGSAEWWHLVDQNGRWIYFLKKLKVIIIQIMASENPADSKQRSALFYPPRCEHISGIWSTATLIWLFNGLDWSLETYCSNFEDIQRVGELAGSPGDAKLKNKVLCRMPLHRSVLSLASTPTFFHMYMGHERSPDFLVALGPCRAVHCAIVYVNVMSQRQLQKEIRSLPAWNLFRRAWTPS
jgi:hypothetical protein